MDIEKLIEQLNAYSAEHQQHGGITAEAADALSTLQAENEKLKDQLYDGEGTNLVEYWMQQAKIEGNRHRNCQAENEKLRAELNRCKEKNAGLALALLTECAPNPDCLGDDEWRAIRAELEQVKQERDAAVDCIYQIEDDLDRGNDNDWAREHIAEWESQKED